MRGFALLLIPAIVVTGCKKLEPKAVTEAKAQHEDARDRRVRQACASQASYERLKALAFEKAKDVRQGDPAVLDRLAATTVVRMEQPVVKNRDDALNVTICGGKMVIELPPGTEDAFNGARRLTADVEYAAQAAADGSGLVYSLDGAEPIIYRLAAIDLKNGPQTAQATPAPTPVTTPAPLFETEVADSPPAPPQRPVAPAPSRPEPPRPAMARPSFNCRYARTSAEQMICADERLAARDRAMASLYYQAIAQTDPETRTILRGTRDRFLARRERCGSPECIADLYEDRIDEIDRIASGE